MKLVIVYENANIDVRRWDSRVESNLSEKGETDFSDRFYSGRLSTAVNKDEAKQDNVIIFS